MLQQLQSNLATGKEFCPFGSKRGSQPGVHAKKEAYGLTDNLTNVLGGVSDLMALHPTAFFNL